MTLGHREGIRAQRAWTVGTGLWTPNVIFTLTLRHWHNTNQVAVAIPGTPATTHMSMGEPGTRYSSTRDPLNNSLSAIPRSGRYTQSSRSNNHMNGSNIGRTTSASIAATEPRGSRRHDEHIVPRTSTIRRVGGMCIWLGDYPTLQILVLTVQITVQTLYPEVAPVPLTHFPILSIDNSVQGN